MNVEQFAPIAWPLVFLIAVLFSVLVFYRPLSDLISSITSIKVFNEKGDAVQVTASEVRGIARDLLNDVDQMLAGLGPAEKRLLADIRGSQQTPRVRDVIPGFKHESKEHNSLRKLRKAQLIRPVGGGSWKAEKFIELKDFGRTLLKIRGDHLKA